MPFDKTVAGRTRVISPRPVRCGRLDSSWGCLAMGAPERCHEPQATPLEGAAPDGLGETLDDDRRRRRGDDRRGDHERRAGRDRRLQNGPGGGQQRINARQRPGVPPERRDRPAPRRTEPGRRGRPHHLRSGRPAGRSRRLRATSCPRLATPPWPSAWRRCWSPCEGDGASRRRAPTSRTERCPRQRSAT